MKIYNASQKKAEEILRDRIKVKRLVESAAAKIARVPAFKKLSTDLYVLARLLKCWIRGEYKQVPWKTLIAAVAAFVYFVNPFDAICDFIPFYGMLDDAMVFSFVLKLVSDDLKDFLKWEEMNPPEKNG